MKWFLMNIGTHKCLFLVVCAHENLNEGGFGLLREREERSGKFCACGAFSHVFFPTP
jgi:hypothetical protein